MDRSPRAPRNPLVILALLAATAAAPPERTRWDAQAARVSITRDDWGIAHVHGRSDADAVFGAIYAQAEDDFPRIERNYLTALGRTAEADGEGALWADLRQRLYVDPADLQARYRASPAWLRALMDAWADGLNFYLATHPAVRPKVLTRFEPWMALSFTEGSIGGDIERIDLANLRAFYDRPGQPIAANRHWQAEEPRGSNGIAIAPRNTANGRALLLINPHTSFYFRAELQMTSDAGLNAYGASTWGQFFIYQGFNADAGWMHTSSGVDNVDEFVEDVKACPDRLGTCYRTGRQWRPFAIQPVTLRYRQPDGRLGSRTVATLRNQHGPVIAGTGKAWRTFAMMWKPVPALEQSWLRTRTRSLSDYRAVAARQANSSNATLFADRRGEIAYLHPQFVPIRDARIDYRQPVDGADPASAWRGLHPLAALPDALNPRVGWVMNTNNWPWSAAGSDSPKQANYPRYMDSFGENARGEHALLLLKGRRDWTAEKLIAAAYDPFQPGFAKLIPQLIADYDAAPVPSLRPAIDRLRGWDFRWSATSVETSLAVFWGDAMAQEGADFMRGERLNLPDFIATQTTPARRLAALGEAIERLRRDFGDWRVPWGRINRFQRLDAAIAPRFDDAQSSTPVPFTSAQWGSLASFGARRWPGTKTYYGTSGNSFVAVVEFGPRVRAWAVTAGGASGDAKSSHFRDQIQRYADGALRQIYFHSDELAGHVARRYRPGG
ncbi:MAG: penicillin acylase family protein [Pseudomonadota bacterium]